MALLKAWQLGKTGYPIIDAGMRELWQTGSMHNRVRMLVASFLTKNCLIDWRLGAQWFWDCLVDADLASNSASWQWVAGCGADAGPYFRIFNPVLQSKKFDLQGHYIRNFVPEISALDNRDIHMPAAASPKALLDAKIILGIDYPVPIIDLAETRKIALALYRGMRN
jgi:deoxyribodipyrimidine photo-lyase